MFAAKPQINEDDVVPDHIFTSVCERSPRIAPGMTFTFEFSRTFYVIAGTAHSPIEPGVSLVITAVHPVVLGSPQKNLHGSIFTLVAEPGKQPELIKGQPEGFDLPRGTHGFWVVTNPDFTYPTDREDPLFPLHFHFSSKLKKQK